MHFRLFNAITKHIEKVTDGQLLVANLQLRDRLVAGDQPTVFLNTLYNLTSAEMVRRAQQERDWETLLSCDLCHTTVSECDGRWVFSDFVCAHCMPQLMRQLV